MRIEFYCTKGGKKLVYDALSGRYVLRSEKELKKGDKPLNGTICAEARIYLIEEWETSEWEKDDDVDGKPYTMRGTDIGRKFVAKGGAFHKGEFWTSDSRERNEIYRNSCLSQSDIEKYVGGIWKRFYCWRVYAASQTFPRECANPPQSWRYDGKERNRILMSINPKWLAKILNGEKTIEVRKTAPKELVRYERE